MLRAIAVLSTLISVSVMAQTPPAGSPPGRPMMGRPGMGGGGGQRGGNPTCTPLKEACLKAGYSMTEPRTSEKSAIGGCMAKFARGESVKGVTMKPTDKALEPCINFMKMKMAQMGAGAGAGGPAGGPARGGPRGGADGKPNFGGAGTPPPPGAGAPMKTPPAVVKPPTQPAKPGAK